MQEKVSRAIVEALKVELTPEENRRLGDHPIQNAYAFECYLKARREIWRWGEPSSLDRAMEYLERGSAPCRITRSSWRAWATCTSSG